MHEKKSVQVVTIGNAFELVYQDIKPYANLTELARVDERHFGQKSAFWATRHGWPSITISTLPPSELLLDLTYGDKRQPTFIQPFRRSSSICLDLLADLASWSTFTSSLDRTRRVFLAPYVHSLQVDELAARLIADGFTLSDYKPQAPLVNHLCSKIYTQQYVFEHVDELRRHRPKTLVAWSARELQDAARYLAREGVEEVVVKSAAAVGGAGVFFVEAWKLSSRDHPLDNLLSATGQNYAERIAPFLVEERVPWDVSPTVDMEVLSTGQVEIVGIALQRLYDERYYTGFYSTPRLEQRWWFRKTLCLAKVLGRKLSSLGYAGPANIDFVVSENPRRLTLIELNPRRSALLDGFGVCQLRGGTRMSTAISVADYVNVAQRFVTLGDVVSEGLGRVPGFVLPIADGGFYSSFRWAGIWAAGSPGMDSETILEAAVDQLQDPERDEVGSAGRQVARFRRISENAA